MKMAKASEADLKMALELVGMLEGFERGHFPVGEADEEYEAFYDDNPEHCLRAMELILYKLQLGSLSRVVFGMSVLLDPKNEAVDPDCDYLEHHPKVRMHDELVEALRSLLDEYESEISSEWSGTSSLNKMLARADPARAVLAKVEGR